MPLLTDEQMQDGSDIAASIEPGQSAEIIISDYAPFFYGVNKDKKMPKYKAKDASTGKEYEIVGFKFHDQIKLLNDQIEPGITVLKVDCLDNGSRYPDYNISVVAAGIKTDSQAF